ncbi:hypothetical protein [Actinomadura monticuli]|uniref:Uncharacterized protein n=1 Tax=Actinomadura monticuli TaxID=3097367 RepID=A0ABV4QGK8_9ACTN
MAKATGITLLLISVISGLLAILQVLNARYFILTAVAFIGLCGWAAVVYITYAGRLPASPGERLLRRINLVLPINYLETWLRSTLLNQRALDLYWQTDDALQVDEIRCETVLDANDATLCIRFVGTNATRRPAEWCPMVMFGGSVIHLQNFKQRAVSIASDGSETGLYIRNVLDLGQLHYVRISFSVPLQRSEHFEVEHRHSWPGGMAEGEDSLWYPYAAMFQREPERMIIKVTFEEAPIYLRGFCASLRRGVCEVTTSQPQAVGPLGREYEWTVSPVENDCIYGLVFRRIS